MQDCGHLVGGRKGRPNEVMGDLVILGARHQNAVGLLNGSAGAAHLLVVVHHRSGPLEMHHKAEIGLIESHTQRHGGHQRLHLVGQQQILQFEPLLVGQPGVVGARFDATVLQPGGQMVGSRTVSV